ncbi:hypothetical protein IVR12_01333 [Limosilactobacillus reuteri]|nr:hypothetical protein IVR12_01333 [Limosilactobacillus reuteri]
MQNPFGNNNNDNQNPFNLNNLPLPPNYAKIVNDQGISESPKSAFLGQLFGSGHCQLFFARITIISF